MKKFIIRLLYFSVPLIILTILYEVFLSFIPTTYDVKKIIIENNRDSIQTLLFGTSHVFSGLNPEEFNQYTLNIANNSQSLYYDIKILDKYIDELPRLKTVVFEISFFTFWYNLDHGPESWRNKYYFKSFGINPQSNTLSIFDNFYIHIYSPDDIKVLLKSYTLTNSYIKTRGWAMNDLETGGISLVQAGKKYEQFSNEYMNESDFQENVALMKNLLMRMENKNINVFFVHLPISPMLYSFIDPKIIEKNSGAIKDLQKTYSITYLDYSFDDRFPDTVFVDSDHFGNLASIAFSKILNKDIERVTKIQNIQ